MWRKNRNYKKGRAGICIGVDPNRNWPVHWAKTMVGGTVRKDGKSRCTSTWEGPSALSEAEPKTIVNYVHKRGKAIQAFLDVHSYSQEILPPGCNGYPIASATKRVLLNSAKVLSKAMSHKGKQYTTGDCQAIMYACSGTAHDWAFNVAKIPKSYCVEVRPGDHEDAIGFVLPPQQILPTSQELLAGVLSLTSQAVPKYKFDLAQMQKMAAYQSATAFQDP